MSVKFQDDKHGVLDDLDQGGREEDDLKPVLLVVDDDKDILRVVHFYLTKQNYVVHTASGGKEALAILEQHQNIELILSDVMMPGMNGLELLRAIRKGEATAELPVVLISAEGETSKKVVGFNEGANDFITKPFNFDELMVRVKNHINQRRLQRDLLIASRQVEMANKVLTTQNERLLEDLEAARNLQMALMPDALPETPAFRLASCYRPADRLGGDFFDVVELAGGRKLGVLMADVCGHGVSAALITAMTKITFRNACFTSEDPAEVLTRMNEELFGNIQNSYVTVFYGILDTATNEMVYASGGHPPLLVHRQDGGTIESLMPQETFLGYFEAVQFTTDRTTLQPGDRVYFYTDGLFESRQESGEDFTIERVHELIQAHQKAPLQELLDTMIAELEAFTQGLSFEDDITVVGLEIKA